MLFRRKRGDDFFEARIAAERIPDREQLHEQPRVDQIQPGHADNISPLQLGEEVLKSHSVFFGRFFARQASARCQDSVMPHSASLR